MKVRSEFQASSRVTDVMSWFTSARWMSFCVPPLYWSNVLSLWRSDETGGAAQRRGYWLPQQPGRGCGVAASGAGLAEGSRHISGLWRVAEPVAPLQNLCSVA